ncbi:two component transcriptional regulator, winged helix family [Dyella jiangningensis]|uniref:response regulator n=1 Tax=Dyella sp. AtDHG13 TaxID=1938897 RepID=UPI00088BE88E|nr:response regulator [Dyella sp. AtDHG13]PXV53152.1 winged helix family two component transcriptional regulator [Dyella sp. AtDHG13]SDL45083.1 two component transcriptional regulator, winged helix family [Dyella jiangningensis]
MHILLVEDDAQLGSAIQRALERLSYTVSWLRDGRSALNAMRDRTADLVLLDLGLPGRDGIEVLTEARRAHVETPVLVMTARDDLSARVDGLDAGADDYLTKPFHVEELAARIRSLTRRMRGLSVNRIEVGALSLDVGTSEVSFRGEPVDLTRREFALLQALMENAGKLVRRESLENSLYGLDHVVGNNALEVLVHALRRKLSFETIRNVRGFGYMIPQDPK